MTDRQPNDFDPEPALCESRVGTPRPWFAWLCAAPIPLVGVAIGLCVSMHAFRREVANSQARSPGEFVDGLGVVAYLFLGLVGGALGGIIAGAAVAEFVTWLGHRRSRLDETRNE
ncbi:MAG: hypothetical protein GXY83_14890 [Rhodopirellula sp.]|mgnify:CR=1 FL=1|nr:hypothetical protein [Rhodopirellula sp.]